MWFQNYIKHLTDILNAGGKYVNIKLESSVWNIGGNDIMNSIVFIDAEINPSNGQVLDIGAVKEDNSQFHSAVRNEFSDFISDSIFVCGHNIIEHDLKYLKDCINHNINVIDTLCLSPLLFPNKPYHSLLKDDKLQTDELNNPLNDAIKAKELFYDEINAFEKLNFDLQNIYYTLLKNNDKFKGFFKYTGIQLEVDVENVIREAFFGEICENANLLNIIQNNPVELAYCLALISAENRYSITPPWVHKNYPTVENIMRLLRNKPCDNACVYCRKKLDVKIKLKEIFGYNEFRKYNGEQLQEQAAAAAVNNRSLLAIFPTGGGKSITFQLPALMAGESVKGLTVVISPLQSLMKDQVDNLSKLGIVDAVTVNGLLNPIERAEALERVENGMATLLYISPESLRSKTIEKLLLSRNVVRFVIDEAHCFSSWGQDFRVDYQYIGDFIKELQEKKRGNIKIPVSCFTATAKQKVISDIKDYFKQKLDIDLELYATDATRSNLRYSVLYKETDEEKYTQLRELIEEKDCPTIIYVSRTRRTYEIAKKLCGDGFSARPFNGKMESREKIENQEKFINDEVQIIVATSAFGMGVDKKDVGLVIHYDISDSLENYVQEAGRAGRDQSIQAECYVLFNDKDLDKHFILLNQTKLSMSEIQQVWKAIKDLTRLRPSICRSPLEIARQAGWDENVTEIETRVKTAISALETAGYIKRGKNVPRVYATSILVKNMAEASERINNSNRFNEEQKQNSLRIISCLISSKNVARAGNDDAESRVDYISDILGIPKSEVVASINLMREEGLLADSKDLTAYIHRSDTKNKSAMILRRCSRIEEFLLSIMDEKGMCVNLKGINEQAIQRGIKQSTVKLIKNILYYWTIKGYIKKSLDTSDNHIEIVPEISIDKLIGKYNRRIEPAQFIVKYLYDKSFDANNEKDEVLVQFSVLELLSEYEKSVNDKKITFTDVEDALLYLSKIDSLNLEGGFLVLYSALEIKRLVLDNRIKYKVDDYKKFSEFYRQRIQQIHIVGEYANMMVKSYSAALQFVNDYFQMDYKKFIAKYFKEERADEINRNITPAKYKQLFDNLSITQRKIIDDDSSKYIVVTAGPGSGKTRILVHKLASLMLLEDVKHEQLLMVTFSRAAATEFKMRLMELIGNAASFIEIKTFHSYCFDLVGQIGKLENADTVVRNAAEMIKSGEVEIGRITKTVIVIDEAQDMDADEFALIEALMDRNDDMRVIAVGDDDQNIYEFRGSDSKYLESFITEKNAVKYELVDNYRSKANIVKLSNKFAETIEKRLKSDPIVPIRNENGIVKLFKQTSKNLEIPVVENIKRTYKGTSACVLTNTNDEALRVMGLLMKEGIKARLIQSNDGFNLYNLAEVRYFIKMLLLNMKSPIISDEIWVKAKNSVKERYNGSECLEVCLNMLNEFEKVNVKKYYTDFEMFVKESQYADFYENKQDEIIVSTIHKSKGREFDSVYMLLNKVAYDNDEQRRKIYVGLTRAKNELYVHYNNACFDNYGDDDIELVRDDKVYAEPNEIIMQLTHRDVYLGFFKGKKNIIGRMKRGDVLSVHGEYLYINTLKGSMPIVKFSKKYIDTLYRLGRKGYVLNGAKVRFIVAWKGEEDDEESAVILPEVYLRKGR